MPIQGLILLEQPLISELLQSARSKLAMSKAFLKDIDNTIHYSSTADVSSETNSSSFFASATNPDARREIRIRG